MNNNMINQAERVKRLKELGLSGMAEALENQYNNEVSFSGVSFDQRLDFLIQRQEAYKKESAYKRIIHHGKLRYLTSFNDLHFKATDGVSNEDLMYLMSNNWALANPVNIIIQGPCGVGKTALACCLLNGIAKEEQTIRFYNFKEMILDIESASMKDPLTLKKLINRLSKIGVLAIDNFLSEKISVNVKSALFNIIDGRWMRRPLIVTSQLAIEEYRSLLGGDQSAEGLIDRLLKPAKILTLEGKSKRPTM